MNNNTLNKRSVFITGANGGMGLETSKLLAKSGFGRIVLAARTDEKAIFAKREITKDIIPIGEINAVGGFDMNRPEQIEQAVENLPAERPFDILFFQVGGVFFTKNYQYVSYNNYSIEKTIFQNVIGSYITLINLERRGLIAPNARIIFAGGEGARGIKGLIDKPVFETREKFRQYLLGEGNLPKYNPMNAIGVSKLASALLVQKLATSNDGKEYIWFSPGLTHGTNGLAKTPPVKRFFMEKIMFGITGLLGLSQSPKRGAQKYLDCLVGEIGKNGDVLGAPEGKALGKITDQKPMNESLTDKGLQDEFLSILNKIYILDQEKSNPLETVA